MSNEINESNGLLGDSYSTTFESNMNDSIYFQDLNKSTITNIIMSPNLYSSSSSVNESLVEVPMKRQRDEELAKIEMAVLSCIFIVTLMGNFIVIMGIYFRRQKMSRMYYFILHLSIADLITAFFNVGTQFFMELSFPEFYGDNILCKLVKFAQILGPYSSSYVLVVTALDRYQAICFPLSNCTWTAKRSKLMIGIAWTISFLFCVPQLFIFSLQEVMGTKDCWASFVDWGEKVYVIWYAISFFIVPLIILIFAYSCICRTIWLNFSMKTATSKQESHFGNGNTNPMRNNMTEFSNDAENDSVFRSNRSSFHGQHNGNSGLVEKHEVKMNRLNNSKSNVYSGGGKGSQKNVEVSWRIDTTGNPTTVTGGKLKESKGWKGYNNQEDSDYTSSPEREHEIHEELLAEENSFSPTHVEIVPKQNGVIKYTNEKPKKSGFKAIKIKYKWSANRKRAEQSTQNVTLLNASLSGRSRFSSSETKGSNDHGESLRLKPNLIQGQENDPLTVKTSIGTESTSSCSHKTSTTNSSSSTRRNNNNIQHAMTKKNSMATFTNQPRTSSVKEISRAKIKTVKLTVTVICCYIFCSSPFIAAQLWATFDPYAHESPFYTGTTFTILTLLASLNSCVNPWIFLFFNPNLLQDFLRGFGVSGKFTFSRSRRQSGSPVTQRTSPGLLRSTVSSFHSVRGPHSHHLHGPGTSISAVQRQAIIPSSTTPVPMESPYIQGRRLYSSSTTSSTAGICSGRESALSNHPSHNRHQATTNFH